MTIACETVLDQLRSGHDSRTLLTLLSCLMSSKCWL